MNTDMKTAPANSSPIAVGPVCANPSLACAAVSSQTSRRLLCFGVFVLVLLALFHRPLSEVFKYVRSSDFNSYILAIPVFVAYLVILKRNDLRGIALRPSWIAIFPFVLGVLALVGSLAFSFPPISRSAADVLCLPILGFVCLICAGGFLFLGKALMRTLSFPVALLFLICPLPTPAVESIKSFLQITSTYATKIFLQLFGIPFIQQGFVFDLPGIKLRVAEECSGINASLVLFIVSLVAGYLFLRSPWRRAALTFLVIPLCIVRNGFRIFTLASLCVYVNPSMIDSAIHHKGGPIFFGISLIPFSLLLFWLRRAERRKQSKTLQA